MKKYLFILAFFLSTFLFLLPGKSYATCLTMTGHFTADNWPGGTVRVWCSGDPAQGVSKCGGDSATVAPGEAEENYFTLFGCSCLEEQGKRLQVEGLPEGCTVTTNLPQGSNGDAVMRTDFHVSCPKPTPACNTACNLPSDCEGAENGCTACLPGAGGGKVCKPPATPFTPPPPPPGDGPACNTTCQKDSDCSGAKDSCTTCNPSSKTCQPAPACDSSCVRDSDCYGDAVKNGCTVCTSGRCKKPGPTPTNPPACNVACTRDSDCVGDAAKNGCTVCTSGKCNKPTPSPTTPVACNTSCTKDSECAGAKDSCTDCNEGTKRCQPAPTPTPAFNENWCTCDGLETNPASFFPGDSVSFISFGKVEAPYLSRAKVESMSFFVYRGSATTATRIADSGAIPSSLESQSSTKNRYKSTWSYKIPTDIKKDEIFRVQSKIKCVPQNVLGASIKYQPTLIDRVITFIGFLFGFRSQPAAVDYQATPVPTQAGTVSTPSPDVLAAQDSLQIDTFRPAKIIEKSCSIIRFTFND